ncbi:hypothetical protein FRC01_007991 [Tulasnella sp. 417]|nr:hypothetical protein FRC01_007991 [Tulasnella sp. 417]
MAHDDEELDWGEDDGWAAEQVVATMDVDRPDLIHTGGNGSVNQHALDQDDSPHVSENVGESQEQRADVSATQSSTRNGSFDRKDSRRTPSRSSSDFGKALPSSLPQRPSTTAPHVEESDPLAASAMARSPNKSTNGLPPEWEERKSRSNGSTYYFNLKTEETTWTKPTPTTAGSSTTSGTPRPDSPTTSRREKERRAPTSPNVPSTLPPAPFSLPARPQAFNSSGQRRDRSASPPPRARSRERQKEAGRDSRAGQGDRRPAGRQTRPSPPPRPRDIQMRDPSPEPTRRPQIGLRHPWLVASALHPLLAAMIVALGDLKTDTLLPTATMANEITMAKKILKSSGDVSTMTVSMTVKMIAVTTVLGLVPLMTEGDPWTIHLPRNVLPYLRKIIGSALRCQSRLVIALHDDGASHLP